MSNLQKVFVMLKPAAFSRNLVDDILCKIRNAGFIISHKKIIHKPLKELIAIQYPKEEFIVTNRLFSRERIINYCASGPIIVMIVVGEEAIKRMKILKGSPDPKIAKPDTIRSLIDDTIEEADAECRALRDIIHSSDDEIETNAQIKAWFGAQTDN
jgi:nucleoside-diphosphate kinase